MKDFKPKETKVASGQWTVFLDLCKGCGLCLEVCPKRALIFGKEKGVYSTPAAKVLPEKCTLCGICELNCPDSAIRVDKKKS